MRGDLLQEEKKTYENGKRVYRIPPLVCVGHGSKQSSTDGAATDSKSPEPSLKTPLPTFCRLAAHFKKAIPQRIPLRFVIGDRSKKVAHEHTDQNVPIRAR